MTLDRLDCPFYRKPTSHGLTKGDNIARYHWLFEQKLFPSCADEFLSFCWWHSECSAVEAPSLWYVLGSTAHRRSWANPWKTIRLLGASLHLPGSLTAVHIIKSRQQASTLVYGPHIILLIFVISLSLLYIYIYIHIRSVNLEMCLCNYDMNIHIYVYNYITYHISYIIDHTSVCGSIFISVISMLLAA